jgi:c-di-GMP-related signal transduction protein
MLEKFIARQPIFDDKLKLFGYELLYRAAGENAFRPYKEASGTLIVDSTMLFGLQTLTGHAKAFINFDLLALQRGTARLLPPDQVVIEILENITPTQEVVQLCAELCNEGYTLALDDYVGHPKWEPLLPLVKFLKVDFRGCDPPVRAAIANRHRNKLDLVANANPGANANGMRLLAEKIETNDDLLEARSLGYTFFQGYFFCKPTTLSAREIPGNKLNCLRLLHLVASPDFNYDAVEQLLKTDPALVYKLLRYLNSWLVAVRGEIHSIREAIALLGEKEFRRWISVLAVVAMASDKPHELIRTALTRAFFCENLAKALTDPPALSAVPSPASVSTDSATRVSLSPISVPPASAPPVSLSPISVKSSDLFLMGLLSVTDAILDRPMEQVLATLPIAPEVRAALCGTSNPYRDVYDLLLAYERADWPTLTSASTRLGIHESAVADCESKARQSASIA